ncbi:hypothetical protein HO173_010844 [Letharia columbiana]|uniref:DUF1753-domain-containing protein n=1 Tax=Letharia columbiana TaxID=112416 RepID=A0A8H6FLW4_9LECA|nr:uncharacterized protein HO173_010844 [Letharia columbiana]KAF6230936.1 hypothetical protein HO173_010844 [Letharia columbiana]
MGFPARIFRIPRPKTFLYLMSLRTGTELSTLSLLLNKVSGLYGLLALLTGLHLSPLQLSMYIYSLFALLITILLAPHIRTQSPFHCLALATFYILDSIINAAYTAAFGITWFLVISQHHSDANGGKAPGAGGETIGDTAGFTSPEFNVSHVDVAVGPDQGVPGHKNEAVTSGSLGSPATTAASPSLGDGVLQPESISSIVAICALWAIRVYFVLIIMSYARLVLRRYVASTSRTGIGSKLSGLIEDPFAIHLPEGKGWRGRLGRVMISVGRGYWLGSEEGDDAWMNDEVAMGRMKRREPAQGASDAPGVVERERRRRSGTGPPPPMPQLQGGQGQHLRVQEVRDGK